MTQTFASDYIDVATRIVEFRDKFPDGSLQPADPAQPYRIETIGDTTWIVVVAAAYRTPDDARPGIGMAYEQFPGRTPYTRNSELQNAETSAWGRAIVAALAGDTKKGIASADEVRNRRADEEVRSAPPVDQAKLTRTQGRPAEPDPWQTPADPVNAKKAEVWDAAIAAGVIDPGTPKEGSRKALAAEYAQQIGGDLATAALEELDQFLAALKAAAGVS